MLLALSGALALAAQRATQPPAVAREEHAGPPLLRSATLRILTLLLLLMGAVFGAIEVATVAYAQERGAISATGWLLGLFALSSGLTGLYLGARPGRWSLAAQLLVGTAALTIAAASLPLLDRVAVYAVGMFASGLGVSAVLIGSLQIIERAVPRGRLTESLAVAIAGIQVGFAAAAAVAGSLIDRGGSSWGLAVGSAAAAAGLLLALTARRHLVRAEAGPVRAVTAADLPRVTPGA